MIQLELIHAHPAGSESLSFDGWQRRDLGRAKAPQIHQGTDGDVEGALAFAPHLESSLHHQIHPRRKINPLSGCCTV